MVSKNDVTAQPAPAQEARHRRWLTGLGTLALVVGGGPVGAIEPEQILSYNIGKLAIQPQADISAQFWGNLLYGAENPSPGGPVTMDREINGQVVPVTFLTPPEAGVESDLLWYLSPGFELQYGANPENSLSLGYFHDFILYTENGDFNGNQDRVQFDARMELGRFTVVGYNSVAWLDTILGGSTAVVRREPIRRQVWTDNYQITYDSSVKTDVYVIFNHSAVNYLEVVNLYNQATLRGTVGATYKPTERIGLFSEISGGHTDVSETSPLQPPGEDSWVYGGFVGVRGTFTPRITGTVKVGYETRDFTGPDTQGDGGGPAVGVGLTYTPTQRLLVKLDYNRFVGVSPQFAGQSTKNGVLSLSGTQQLGVTGRWAMVGRFGASFGSFSTLSSTGTGVVDTPTGPQVVEFPVDYGRDDRTYTASLGVQFQPRAWVTALFAYSFEKYETQFDDEYAALRTGLNDYVLNRVILQVSVGY